MPKVQETKGQITFIEKIPSGVRIFLTIVGFIPMVLAPYELLFRSRWNGFSVVLAISILISLGAILVGGLFVVAGLLGLNHTLTFETNSESIYYSYESAVLPLGRKTFRFGDVDKISVKVHDWSEGPSTYSLQVLFRDGQKIESGSFEKREEAEQYVRKVENLIRSEGKVALQ